MSIKLKKRVESEAAKFPHSMPWTNQRLHQASNILLEHYSEAALLAMDAVCLRAATAVLCHALEAGADDKEASEYLSQIPMTLWPSKLTYEEWKREKDARAGLPNNVVMVSFGKQAN